MTEDMAKRKFLPSRRSVLAAGVGLLTAGLLPHQAIAQELVRRGVGADMDLPAIGLGSWITFNVGRDAEGLARSAAVIKAFFEAGGRLVDSSPMYGSAQATIGHALRTLGTPGALFAADKVWTNDDAGSQIAESARYWGLEHFSLLQVHNLLEWERHLPVLTAMKARGELGYVGVTTSHGRRHRELETIMTRHDIDFIQLTYNLADREAERRILPLARERGIAVIANRPYQGGRLIRRLKQERLPDWALGAGFETWPDFALRFIISHPALTCAIPATTQVAHVRENMAAGSGPVPDEALRRRMAAYIEDL